MRHTINLFLLFTLLTGTLVWTGNAQAIPVFARKYGFQCTMCHAAFPRLNDFGLRYRENGYQLPGRENDERTVFESPAPIAFRTMAGYTDGRLSSGGEKVRQFQVSGFDVLSGGLLNRDIGYILGYAPRLEGGRGLVDQPGTLDLANVIFTNVCGSPYLNIRPGRIEGAYTAFSVQRQLTLAPYEIYNFSFPGGVTFAGTQTGIELTGHSWNGGWRYAAGLVNGAGTNAADDPPEDLYIRGAMVFGRGEGQTSGQRLGLTGYLGKARPEGVPAAQRENFHRWGVDASLNFSQLNLALQYLTASDNGALWGAASAVKYTGGFAELNYYPSTSLVGFLRYDLVNAPDNVDVGDISRWTIGGRYYFIDHLAFHLEFSRRRETVVIPVPGVNRENFLTARLDYAF
jgi:hypothetical protein